MKPKRSASFIILALFTVLASLYLTSCASIPFRAGVTYNGMTASYDGKRVLLDVDANSLRGYAK
jgi:hypothetical protein